MGQELIKAIESNNTNNAMHLIKSGADLTAKNAGGSGAFRLACVKGQEDVAMAILGRPEFNVNAKGKMGNTPLIDAAAFGAKFVNVCEQLLSKGADINAMNDFGQTALGTACSQFGIYGDGTALYLINSGADVNKGATEDDRPFRLLGSPPGSNQLKKALTEKGGGAAPRRTSRKSRRTVRKTRKSRR